jgi:hypothetical protein
MRSSVERCASVVCAACTLFGNAALHLLDIRNNLLPWPNAPPTPGPLFCCDTGCCGCHSPQFWHAPTAALGGALPSQQWSWVRQLHRRRQRIGGGVAAVRGGGAGVTGQHGLQRSEGVACREGCGDGWRQPRAQRQQGGRNGSREGSAASTTKRMRTDIEMQQRRQQRAGAQRTHQRASQIPSIPSFWCVCLTLGWPQYKHGGRRVQLSWSNSNQVNACQHNTRHFIQSFFFLAECTQLYDHQQIYGW